MGHIVYSLAGEGRGHATRALTLVEELKDRHRFTIYASGHAHQMLASSGLRDAFALRRLPDLMFRYGRGHRVDYLRTVLSNLPYLRNLGKVVSAVTRELDDLAPDVIITDFEPVLARAAATTGLTSLSIDHQHFLLSSDLRGLPLGLQLRAEMAKPFLRAFYKDPHMTLVSSFHSLPRRSASSQVRDVGVLLRRSVRIAESTDRGYFVAYLRRYAPDKVLKALWQSALPFRIYGLGKRATAGALRFFEVHPERFVDDLAGCTALVSTAGNQLVGEALYLRKPVLAIPEERNFEQRINACLLRLSQCGEAWDASAFSPELMRRFCMRAPIYRERIDPERFLGNPAVVGIVERFAGGPRPSRRLDLQQPARQSSMHATHRPGGPARERGLRQPEREHSLAASA